MNLVMLSPTFHPHRGGAESLADDLGAIFAARDHAVTVVTSTGEPGGAPETRRGMRVLRVRHPPPHRPPFATPALLAAGIRMRRWYRELLTTGAVDAVCIARLDESCRDVLALRRKLGFRLSLYLHGGELRALQREWPRFRAVLRWALREADAVVAVSEDLRREAAAFAPAAASKIRWIPNGIDVAAVRAVAPTAWPRPYALFVGRLEPVKNPAFLIAAFAVAAAEVGEFDLVLAGTGSEDAATAALIAAHGLTDRVHLIGAVDRERVWALMKGARCLVVPSLAEGHPLVVLEAWAAGLPVLASAAKGLRTLVGEDRGAQFALDDPHGLARLLVRFARDDAAILALRGRLASLDCRDIDLGVLAERHLAAIGDATGGGL